VFNFKLVYYDYLMLSFNAKSALPMSTQFDVHVGCKTRQPANDSWYNDYLNIIFITNRAQKDVNFAKIFVQIKVCCFSCCVFNL